MALGDIILGDGVFGIVTSSGATPLDVGLTRGGGQFVVEREFRDIEADGDYGSVAGRILETKHVPKLTIRGLEIAQANITNFYPGSTMDAVNSTSWTGTLTALTSCSYAYEVTWTGETLGGKDVIISVRNALMRENIDWSMTDKEEILPELTFTGHYGSTTRTTPPWTVTFTTV
jgi:hypothetical protein